MRKGSSMFHKPFNFGIHLGLTLGSRFFFPLNNILWNFTVFPMYFLNFIFQIDHRRWRTEIKGLSNFRKWIFSIISCYTGFFLNNLNKKIIYLDRFIVYAENVLLLALMQKKREFQPFGGMKVPLLVLVMDFAVLTFCGQS